MTAAAPGPWWEVRDTRLALSAGTAGNERLCGLIKKVLHKAGGGCWPLAPWYEPRPEAQSLPLKRSLWKQGGLWALEDRDGSSGAPCFDAGLPPSYPASRPRPSFLPAGPLPPLPEDPARGPAPQQQEPRPRGGRRVVGVLTLTYT